MPLAGAVRVAAKKPVRATQTLLSHMAFCRLHPSLTALEVGWRWLVGIPVLLAAWREMQQILVQVPAASAGLDRLEFQNPWASSVILADAIGRYAPLVCAVLRWFAPSAFVVWAVVSAAGRVAILSRMRMLDGQNEAPRAGLSLWRKLPGVAVLQALWMAALLGCLWLWYWSAGWASSTHITVGAQPDLIGYLCWLIFLSLGYYTLWAMASWTLAAAPVLYVLEDCSVAGALGRSFGLGRELSGKLLEVNLVLAIVKIALIVLAMVFSAAPLPFSDEFGPGFMHALYVVIAIAFLLGNDYFHVVRLRAFVGLRKLYRAPNFDSSLVIEQK